jgi:dTDP-4-dehydrorhamnose reductase
MQPVLVTGAGGMLGSQVVRDAPGPVRGVDLADGDLAEPGVAERLVPGAAGVIHCAGYTDVDGAESNQAQAHRDNVVATASLAKACAAAGVRLLVVSTDFVFDGTSDRPYRETDPPHPLCVYGRTKLEAERAALDRGAVVVRTQWLYGPGGRHFPGRIRALAGPLRVVNDQHGCPTSTLELAPALWDVLAARATGIFHAACEGECTWFDFARLIRDDVEPCSTAEFPRPAQRPAYSVLDCTRLATLRGRRLAHWRQAWKEYAER